MPKSATKTFDIEEGSTETTNYRIVVKFRGKEVERFETPTMLETKLRFELAGYTTLEND